MSSEKVLALVVVFLLCAIAAFKMLPSSHACDGVSGYRSVFDCMTR